jgi:hypothetical protein
VADELIELSRELVGPPLPEEAGSEPEEAAKLEDGITELGDDAMELENNVDDDGGLLEDGKTMSLAALSPKF